MSGTGNLVTMAKGVNTPLSFKHNLTSLSTYRASEQVEPLNKFHIFSVRMRRV